MRSVLRIFVIVALATTAHAASKDIETIRKRYVTSRAAGAPSAEKIAKAIQGLKPDGSWGDIDYKCKLRSGWKPVNHVRRIESMAKAYRKPGHTMAGDPKLKEAITKAMRYWLKKDLKCRNWWYNNIGVPKSIADIMVLMGKDLPADVVKTTLKQVMPRAKIGMTGQNKVWLAGIVFVRCLTDGNEKELKRARDVILSEIRVTTREGIQPDWSFHQHGPQQQFGNYGSAFGGSVTQWAELLRRTSFALDAKQLAIIRNYLLEGPSWILWKGKMDISGCGRQIYNNCQRNKGRGILGQLKRMVRIDPANAKTFEVRLKANEEDGTNTLIGNKHFWRSDMMIHRCPDWYASVKMSSRRVTGAETCNSENMRGMHLGDGVLLVYQTAREYENIQPFWDWHRLPGTTCDQSIKNLVPSRGKCRLPTEFVGGVSDGEIGIAALDYKRDTLVARKTWFFEKDAIVCLGAGITSTKGGLVLTSAQQSLLQGEVTTRAGKMGAGKRQLKDGDWVHHAGIGYHILNGQKPTLQVVDQKGTWRQLYTSRGDKTTITGKVFSLWFDHGTTPKDQKYAYVIYPNSDPAALKKRVRDRKIRILSNTPDLQAISVDGLYEIRAVFYKPGTLAWGKGEKISTDSRCILTMRAGKVFIADPTQKKKAIKLTIRGKAVTVKLPTGGDAGRSVAAE